MPRWSSFLPSVGPAVASSLPSQLVVGGRGKKGTALREGGKEGVRGREMAGERFRGEISTGEFRYRGEIQSHRELDVLGRFTFHGSLSARTLLPLRIISTPSPPPRPHPARQRLAGATRPESGFMVMSRV